MSHFKSLTQMQVRLIRITIQVSPTGLERILQAWAGVPMQIVIELLQGTACCNFRTDLVCSQERIAKKKAPSTRSATWTRVGASLSLFVAVLRNLKSFRRNLGVIAFCRSGGGSVLSNAFSKALMAGSNWELPST
jgi:hypothetical protein